jgi:hypothetical protein
LDLTLKQRRETDLKTRRPAPAPTIRYAKTQHGRSTIAALDHDGTLERPGTLNVRVKNPSRMSLRDAPLFAPYHYLEAEEVRKIAGRIVNRLNVHFFRGRARRKKNPEKLNALIVQHDRDTRRHLHCLFGLPPNVTLKDFKQALRHALKHEPFVFPNAVDDERSCRIEPVEDLRRSVFYNVDERKSLTGMPILYTSPNRRPSTTKEHTE